MIKRRNLLLTSSALLLAACTAVGGSGVGAPDSKRTQSMTTTAESATLTVTVEEVIDRQIRLSYELRNTGERPIYLFNRLVKFGPTGSPTLDDNAVYSAIEGDALVLSRQLVPIPSGIRVEVPEVPGLSEVAPGASLKQSLTVVLPLRERNPYPAGRQARTIERSQVRKLRLVMGYIESDAAPTLVETQDSKGTAYKTIRYQDAVGRQKFIKSPDIPV